MKHVCDKGITLSNSVYFELYWLALNMIVPLVSAPLPDGPPVAYAQLKTPDVFTSFLLKHWVSVCVPYSCGRFSETLVFYYKSNLT